jgi:hypothetical protein
MFGAFRSNDISANRKKRKSNPRCGENQNPKNKTKQNKTEEQSEQW